MVVKLTPETESRLQELAKSTGRAPDELVEDAMPGYLAELAGIAQHTGSSVDQIKSGKVQPIDGEDAFTRLRNKNHSR
jgi:predicted DNA-binding protein